MATGQIQRLNLRHNKASLVDLETGTRYIFSRSEMDEPDTVKKHDIVTFTVSGSNATDVIHRIRPAKETVIKVE
mgnify:CR=1 FL=1